MFGLLVIIFLGAGAAGFDVTTAHDGNSELKGVEQVDETAMLQTQVLVNSTPLQLGASVHRRHQAIPPVLVNSASSAVVRASSSEPESEPEPEPDPEPEPEALSTFSWQKQGLSKAWRTRKVSLSEKTLQTPDTGLAAQSGMSMNGKGDLDEFLAGLSFNIKFSIVCVVLFIVGAYSLPQMYAFRATGDYLEGQEKRKAQTAPITWNMSGFPFYQWTYKWAQYSFAYSREQVIETCGLDAAMLIAFDSMAMEILAIIGIPLILLGFPTYYFLGGMAAGEDKLSYLGIGNVKEGSWIFVPVSFSTWFVVVVTQYRLFQWMRTFMKYREAWLMGMPAPQDATLLVEGIPDEYCSDACLKKYFGQIYGDKCIKEAFVVKKCGSLESMVESYKKLDRYLKETLFSMRKPGTDVQRLQSKQTTYIDQMNTLQKEIKAEQERVLAEAKKDPVDTDIYATNGFVTFTDRKFAEQAVFTRLTASEDEFIISHPPQPADVIYSDLEESVAGRVTFQLLGYVAIAGLFFGYMPIVSAISQAWRLEHLENKFPWFKSFTEGLGESRDTLAALLATVGLNVMSCLLPSFLMLIFKSFYTLKASRWAQLEVQTYYFWFLILFVLLTTSIDASLIGFTREVAESPFVIFSILANQMPMTTHFYMNYITLQWPTHAMNMLRYGQVFKYLTFKRVMDPEDARSMAEPEDQDYYGIGSRSSRHTLFLIIGLVFSSICPLLVILVFINHFCSRLFLGYLIPYAETRKADLGGDHFALQLIHVHLGLLIYITLMTGITLQRAATHGPGIIAAASFLWWAISFNKFRTKLHWETLPYQDVVLMKDVPKRKSVANKADYQQTALDPNILSKINADPFEGH
mmetsp:Transcript_125170/g.227697  ORF Transcript_125170/g.227697 Transcript_125170/m.227697 type:complete len:859 (-) Transcript_125170:268-2844(-)